MSEREDGARAFGRRLRVREVGGMPRAGVGVWAFILSVAILAARGSERLTGGYLWAEDATIFLKGAVEHGFWPIVEPFAGYIHSLPRIIAWLQSVTGSIETAPYVYVWTALLLTGVSCVICAATLQRTLCAEAPVIAVVMSLVPALVPHNGEVYLSITNLQWVTAPAFLALVIEASFWPAPPRWTVPLILFLGLSGGFAPLFAPVVVAGLLLQRRLSWGGASVLAAAVVALVAFATSDMQSPSLGGVHWRQAFFADLLMGLFTPTLAPHPLAAVARVVGRVLPLAILAAAWSSTRRSWALAFIALAVVTWAAGALRAAIYGPGACLSTRGHGARYLVVPAVLLGWALLVGSWQAPRWSIVVRGVLALLLVGSMLRQPVVDAYPPWQIKQTAPGAWHVRAAPPVFQTTIRAPGR